MVLQTENDVISYLEENNIIDINYLFAQWRDGIIEPFGETILDVGSNDWWWYVDNGDLRVWTTKPNDADINSPWQTSERAKRLAQKYNIVVLPLKLEDGGGFYAYSEAFPGLIGDGETVDSAENDLREVLADAIERRIHEGRSLPQF